MGVTAMVAVAGFFAAGFTSSESLLLDDTAALTPGFCTGVDVDIGVGLAIAAGGAFFLRSSSLDESESDETCAFFAAAAGVVGLLTMGAALGATAGFLAAGASSESLLSLEMAAFFAGC